MAPRRKPFPSPLWVDVENLSHDGRGIARPQGKTTFIDNALPGEQVLLKYSAQRRRFDEGFALEVRQPHPQRVEPPCIHARRCGGCSLQHVDSDYQVALKHEMLREQFAHFGNLQPEQWLPPLRGDTLGYRNKARLGVRVVDARNETLVGFREKRSSYLAVIGQCQILVPEVGLALPELATMLHGLQSARRIPQIELAAGDDQIGLIFRHLDPLPEQDLQQLIDFCATRGWHCYLQPGSDSSVHRVWPEQTASSRLFYRHPAFDISLAFHPTDFIQVNSSINRQMVPLALELLDVSAQHEVLDLFCGLGNFTLPLARQAQRVTGVEGSERMVERGYENAQRNGLDNLEFFAFDLTQPVQEQPWAQRQYQRILIDPPRAGALEMMPLVANMGADKIVYVSCNAATLARDAGELVRRGYRLAKAGIMDMFPHTTHVESIALFEKAP